MPEIINQNSENYRNISELLADLDFPPCKEERDNPAVSRMTIAKITANAK